MVYLEVATIGKGKLTLRVDKETGMISLLEKVPQTSGFEVILPLYAAKELYAALGKAILDVSMERKYPAHKPSE